MTEYRRSCCSGFHRAVELIGRRWAGVIVHLLAARPSRFAALQLRLPDITPRMLTERLRELEAEGIIERRVLPGSPTGVEYALSKKGSELSHALKGIGAWAHRWLPEDGTAPARARMTNAKRGTTSE
jgi:DNA-binding HxlR family transcriptional regulator